MEQRCFTDVKGSGPDHLQEVEEKGVLEVIPNSQELGPTAKDAEVTDTEQ